MYTVSWFQIAVRNHNIGRNIAVLDHPATAIWYRNGRIFPHFPATQRNRNRDYNRNLEPW